jgi:hypothetical protein
MRCRSSRSLARFPFCRQLGVLATALPILLFSPCVLAYPDRVMNSAQVEVDVFSGRPNPIWNLTAPEAQAFVQRFAALPSFPGDGGGTEQDQGLGYRGLKVNLLSEGQQRRVSIGQGKVVVEEAGSRKPRQLQDPERRLEQWLLQTGREHLDPHLFHHLLNETAGGARES